MPINIIIDDSRLVGFNDLASGEVKAGLEEYADVLLKECNNLEQIRRHVPNDPPDVSRDVVKDTILSMKRMNGVRSRSSTQAIRILAPVCSWFVGWMFNPDLLKAQGTLYFYAFIILLVISVVLIVLSVIRE